MTKFSIPILFIVFNRPEQTSIVYEAIKQVKPMTLFVAADGPRSNIVGEKDNCVKVRQLFNKLDWDCDLKTLFRDKNIGCRNNVSSAIAWFFENVEEGIILEDDCLPDSSFFQYCAELINYYRHNERIMMISGDNFQFGKNRTNDSYYFSRYTHVWGWATWRDRWKLYDVHLSRWPEIDQHKFLTSHIDDKNEIVYWQEIFNKVHNNKIDTRDYQFLFTCWINKRLSIIPNVNLVSNIGFGCAATHTKNMSPFSNMETSIMDFPLKHPSVIQRNAAADAFTSETHYRRFLSKRLKSYFISRLHRLLTI